MTNLIQIEDRRGFTIDFSKKEFIDHIDTCCNHYQLDVSQYLGDEVDFIENFDQALEMWSEASQIRGNDELLIDGEYY